MTKRELVLAALRGEKVERVPVGFWHHFVKDELHADALADSEIAEANVAGHQQFIQGVAPDFIKLMSDGYFRYPDEALEQVQTPADLAQIQGLSENHPWFTEQVALVRRQREQFVEEIVSFYNIFSPATLLKWQLPGGEKQLAELIVADSVAVAHALQVIAKDLAHLAQSVIQESGTEGIYFSVQNLQDSRVVASLYQQVIAPAEKSVLKAAEAVAGLTVLHICGYEGAQNDLTWYLDYPATAVNWAVTVEGVSLAAGQQLFQRPVLGGFNNTTAGILYQGSQEEVFAETRRLLQEAGTQGVLLGADCTVPLAIAPQRLDWVREAAIAYGTALAPAPEEAVS